MDKAATGKWGEAQAAAYLSRLGFCLVAANYHSRYGEIDLIAADGKTIVFAEVKTRADARFDCAAAAVDGRKIRRISLTAQQWLCENQDCRLQPRFDVIEVYPAEHGGAARINHIENAFFPPPPQF